MDFTRVLELLGNDRATKTLYFTRKTKDGYITYSPEADQDILTELMSHINNYLKSYELYEQIDYNPTGYRDGTIEVCEVNYVGNFDEIINSFDDGNVENIEEEVDNFSFYCIDFNDEENNIKLFRRVTKFKRLYSKGIIAAFQGNRLNKIQDKMLGLDGSIDLIVFNDEIAIINHISLERIFKLEEQFLVKANEAIDCIRRANKMVNFDEFEEDCLNDLKIRKILAKMLKEGNDLSTCFDNFENIIDTINLFELEIEVQNSPEQAIIYEDKRQLMDVLRLVRDSYYRSTVRELPGIDDKY